MISAKPGWCSSLCAELGTDTGRRQGAALTRLCLPEQKVPAEVTLGTASPRLQPEVPSARAGPEQPPLRSADGRSFGAGEGTPVLRPPPGRGTRGWQSRAPPEPGRRARVNPGRHLPCPAGPELATAAMPGPTRRQSGSPSPAPRAVPQPDRARGRRSGARTRPRCGAESDLRGEPGLRVYRVPGASRCSPRTACPGKRRPRPAAPLRAAPRLPATPPDGAAEPGLTCCRLRLRSTRSAGLQRQPPALGAQPRALMQPPGSAPPRSAPCRPPRRPGPECAPPGTSGCRRQGGAGSQSLPTPGLHPAAPPRPRCARGWAGPARGGGDLPPAPPACRLRTPLGLQSSASARL